MSYEAKNVTGKNINKKKKVSNQNPPPPPPHTHKKKLLDNSNLEEVGLTSHGYSYITKNLVVKKEKETAFMSDFL